MARKRNPMARDLLTNPLYRPKRTKSRAERAERLDRWHRRAKHKSNPKSLEPALGCFSSDEKHPIYILAINFNHLTVIWRFQSGGYCSNSGDFHSTVTDFAKLRG